MKRLILASLMLLPASLYASNSIDVPNTKYTPGSVITTDVNTVCQQTYRPPTISEATKKKASEYYGKMQCATKGCEYDMLISANLGGSNDIKNIWVQPYDGIWNVTAKNKLEDRLHLMVCSKQMELDDAQHLMLNWKTSYSRYFGTPL